MDAYVKIDKKDYEKFINIVNKYHSDVVDLKYAYILDKHRWECMPWYKQVICINDYVDAVNKINKIEEKDDSEDLLELFSTSADSVLLNFDTYSFLLNYNGGKSIDI